MSRSLRLSARQKSLLHKFLDRDENSAHERAVALKVDAERFPEYFDDENPSLVRQWEEEIRELSAQGWLRLEHGRGGEAHRLSRLVFVRETAAEISSLLGRMSEQAFLSNIAELLEGASALPVGRYREAWLSFLERERRYWSGSKTTSQSRERMLAERKLIYRATALLLSRDTETEPLSWRQFSVRYFGDSKLLDSFKNEIAHTLYRIAVLQDLDIEADELLERTSVLADFGIIAKERVLYLRGPLRLSSSDGALLADGARWHPFLPIAEGFLDRCEIDPTTARNVLTIENEESFQVLSLRELRPDWILLYLGGFPSTGKLRLLARLAKRGLRLHHWGDLDCGGIEIFRVLERRLDCRILPLAMGPELLDTHAESVRKLSATEIRRLAILSEGAGPDHPLAPTIGAMLKQKCKLEQECVSDPFFVGNSQKMKADTDAWDN